MRAVLVSTLDSTIRLMDKSSGGLLQSYKGHENKDYRIRSALAFIDRYVVSGSEDGHVVAWDLLQAKIVSREKAHSGKVVTAVAVNDIKKEVLSAGVDGRFLEIFPTRFCLIVRIIRSGRVVANLGDS